MRIAELFLKTNDQYHSLIWLLLEGPIFRHISAQFGTTLLCCAANILKFIYIYILLCFVVLCSIVLCFVVLCCVVFYCVVFWVLCYTASHPKDHLPQQLPVCGFSKALLRYFLQRCRKKNLFAQRVNIFAKTPQKKHLCLPNE